MKLKYRIKHRLLLYLTGLVFVVSMIYAGITWVAAYVVEDEIIDKQLQMEATRISQVFDSTGEIPKPSQSFMSLYPDGDVKLHAVLQALVSNPLAAEVFSDDDKHFHLTRLQLASNSYVLVAEVSQLLVVTQLSPKLLLFFSSLFLFALAITLWLVYMLSAMTARPMASLSQEIEAQWPLSVQQQPIYYDEFDYLRTTALQAIEGLNGALERERHFNRDLSHELRTPLTIIKNTLQLSESRPLTNADRKALQLNAERTIIVVDALFTLARNESHHSEAFSMMALLESLIVENHVFLEDQGLVLKLQGSDFQVKGNPKLVALVCVNLIRNAAEHASDDLEITLSEDRVKFENRYVNTIVDAPLDAGVQREGSPGLGMGLFLVKRILDALGWQYRVSMADHHFSFFVIPRRF